MLGDYNIRPRQVRALIVLLILLPLLPTAVIIRFFIDSARYEIETINHYQETLYSSYSRIFTSYLKNQLEQEFAEALENATDASAAARAISTDPTVSEVTVTERGETWQNGQLRENGIAMTPASQPAADRLWQRSASDGSYLRFLRSHGDQLIIRRSAEALEDLVDSLAEQSSGGDLQLDILPPNDVDQAVAIAGAGAQSLDWLAVDWSLRLLPVTTAVPDAGLNEQIKLYRQVTIVILAVVLSLGLLAGIGISQQLKIQDLRITALAAVAHELKTPIASSKVLLETLLESSRDLNRQTEDYLILLARDNQRLAVIVADFLLLSRLEQKSYQPRMQMVRMDELLYEVIDSMSVQLAEAEIEVASEIADDVRVPCDREAMVRVITNLIQNVVQHAADGKWLGVKLSVTDKFAEICISDRGSGIGRAEQKRIFQPFYQVDSSLSRSSEGVGLGLSIVRELVRLHKGRVQLLSSLKAGSSFCLQLPLAG